MANASIFDAFERMWQHVVAAIGNKASVSSYTATIPMHGGSSDWYSYGDDNPTHLAIDIPIEGIYSSDRPQISINYDDAVVDIDGKVISTEALNLYPYLYNLIKTIITYDGGIIVVIPSDVMSQLESGLAGDLPIQLEVTR